MKKLFVSIVVIAAIAVMSGRVNAQATEPTSAGANIITPISIAETSALNFGTMSVSSETGGTCVLSSANVRSATGGVNISTAGTAASTAAYTVTGEASTNYAITLPATITVNKVDGGAAAGTMSISALKALVASKAAEQTTGTLTAGGTDSFTVGGTLIVDARQPTGPYTGTFNVTVAYN